MLAYDLALALGFGSTGSDTAGQVAIDNSNNVIVAGTFTSASLDLDLDPDAYLLENAGGYDGYAAKYDPSGNLLWGIGIGGIGTEQISDAATDGSGNVLLVGMFEGTIEIGAPDQPHITLTSGGNSEGFLAKIDKDGNALWATTFGEAIPRFASSVTADAAGNVYVAGYEGFFGDVGNRLFVAKYSAGGAAVWTKVVADGTGTYYPSSGLTSYASGSGIAVDANSNVYVTGAYAGKINFNPDPSKTSKSSTLSSVGTRWSPSDDAFVLKLSATGAYIWAGSMGGASFEFGNHVAVDGSGSVYVSGGFYSSPNDFNPGSGTLNLIGTAGRLSTFLVKLDPNRNLIWGRAIVGGNDLALDAAGNVFTTGQFSGTIDADPGPGTFNLTASGKNDVVVSKLNSNGSFVWAADILRGEAGSNGSSSGIAVDGSGNVYTTGWFNGTADFDPGAGTYSLISTLDNSGIPTTDAFVSKLVPSNPLKAAGRTTHATSETNLSVEQITPLLTEALARWRAVGVDVSALANITFRIADLGGTKLGLASGNTIWLDDNAAGWGWFVDATPSDDSEFILLGNQGEQNRMDLLSVVMHELGHVLGYDHDDDGGVMSETLAAGVRLFWSATSVDYIFAESHDHTMGPTDFAPFLPCFRPPEGIQNRKTP